MPKLPWWIQPPAPTMLIAWPTVGLFRLGVTLSLVLPLLVFGLKFL